MTDRIALVTGASKGIGAACARTLAQAGFRVAIHFRRGEADAQKLAETLPNNPKIFGADLSSLGACEDLVKRVKAEMGIPHVLVNNAGMSIDQILPFAKEEDFDALVMTNLKPVFLLSKYCSKLMIRGKTGRIINLSSVVGYTGNGGQSIYAATKAAITGFTKSIAVDLAGFGITANCVAPGLIETDMTAKIPDDAKGHILGRIPLKRAGTPEEVASAVEFLASDRAAYITGSTIHVNGGMYLN